MPGPAFNYDDADTNFLKALETGSLLYIDLMYADNSVLKHKENLDTYYTSCYRHWIDAFGEAYGKLSAIYEEGGRPGSSPVIAGWPTRCTAPLTKAANGFWSITPIRRIPARESRCPPRIRDCLNGTAAAEQGRG